MKYIAVLVIIILFVRIDVLLGLFDKIMNKTQPVPEGVTTSNVKSNRETIPMSKNEILKQSQKQIFLALLEDFHSSPTLEIRNQAMSILSADPKMFGQVLDKELEANIYRWREHLNNNSPEAVNFVLDLMSVLQGENLELMKRFFSLWMDINMENFITAYSRSKDTNCSVAIMFGEPVPEEEKVNEYYERKEALNVLLSNPKLDPLHRDLAKNCFMQLEIEISKLAPAQPIPVDQPVAPETVPLAPENQGVSP